MNKLNINKKNIFRSIGTFLIFYLLPYFLIFLLKVLGIKINNNDFMKALLNTLFALIISIILLIIHRNDLKEDFNIFKSDFIKNIDTGFKCWTVGLIIMMISNLILNFVLKAGGANNEQAVQSLLSSLPAIMAIDVFLGSLLHISTNEYNKDNEGN